MTKFSPCPVLDFGGTAHSAACCFAHAKKSSTSGFILVCRCIRRSVAGSIKFSRCWNFIRILLWIRHRPGNSLQRGCNTGNGSDPITGIKNLCFAQRSGGLLRCYFPDFGVQGIQLHHKITELFLCKVCGLFAGPRLGQGTCLQPFVELKETVSHP